MSSVQIIFTGRRNLKRILKEIGLCGSRDIQVMSSCLPLAGDDVVDDGVLVELGNTVVLLGGLVD